MDEIFKNILTNNYWRHGENFRAKQFNDWNCIIEKSLACILM